jgi:hypothetical protein
MKHQTVILFISILFLFNFTFSQSQSMDVVYLKNGSIIRGEIIEQIPDKSIKLQTADGNIFVYNFSDIEKITKEKITTGSAQVSVAQNVPSGFHTHDGFYLSLAGGPAFGTITLNATGVFFKKQEYSGTGFQFDFKIGGVISEEANLILSFDMMGRAISGPTITQDGASGTTTSDITASDVMYGVGITKYFMPSNIFISATVGVGSFAVGNTNAQAKSQSGFGFQLKGGKEWWVSDNWGLGVAAGFAYISADDQKEPSYPSYTATLSTTKFFVVFNTTFN